MIRMTDIIRLEELARECERYAESVRRPAGSSMTERAERFWMGEPRDERAQRVSRIADDCRQAARWARPFVGVRIAADYAR